MKYEYMINYAFPGGNGRICIIRTEKIGSYDDVEEVDKFLREDSSINLPKDQKSKVFVTDFKLLRKYISKLEESNE